MTQAKKRVMDALDLRRPDRMPVFEAFWEEFEEQCRAQLPIPKDQAIDDYFEIDIAIVPADETPFTLGQRVIEEKEGWRVIKDGWGATKRYRQGSYFYEELAVSVETPSDLDKEFDSPHLDCRYQEFLGTVAQEAPKRCVFAKIGGPYIRTSFLRGKEAFLMDIASDPGFAKALAEKVGEHLLEVGLESLKRGNLYDTGIWIYDDMAFNQQPMMSPKAFEQIFLPIYCRMIATLKQAGAKKVCLHSDGNIEPLLDMLVDAGIDGINPVEPRAGLHIPTLKAKYGDKLSYIGGMCNSHILPEGTKAEIERQAKEIIEAAADGGVIIGAHSIGPDVPVENYVHYRNFVMSHQWRT